MNRSIYAEHFKYKWSRNRKFLELEIFWNLSTPTVHMTLQTVLYHVVEAITNILNATSRYHMSHTTAIPPAIPPHGKKLQIIATETLLGRKGYVGPLNCVDHQCIGLTTNITRESIQTGRRNPRSLSIRSSDPRLGMISMHGASPNRMFLKLDACRNWWSPQRRYNPTHASAMKVV